ncbi:hypothetical protein TcasGA2_TC009876 [Tribolium castaneum]|uniref:Thyroglobulin type-1 domain-containing protein n=1 Tax=Tribolium castaneum TaxID=7070 RepID=D6WQ56_TRICA|nr:hypothetical protein TcasGA2_TC009876 [Tribolium castaneum]
MRLFVLLLVICTKSYTSADDVNILCSSTFCSDYTEKNNCRELPDSCKIQNSTYNGLMLPSPDPCNCCQYCLVNLKENDFCAEGEDGGLVPDSICGPGLTCDGGVCKKMSLAQVKDNTPECAKAAADYEKRKAEGNIGTMEMPPNCDDSGFYKPYKCNLGQTCSCVDKDGKRIFGEIPYTSNADSILKCACSRKYQDAFNFFERHLHPNEHFRCTESGDYDTIQCIGDWCMCTDASDGAPTFPSRSSVNISDISSTTLKDCFQEGVHEEGKYYYPCAEKYLQVLAEINSYKKEGFSEVFEVEFPSCSLDGKYAPVQKNEDGGYCANPDGTPMGDYKGDATEMNCNCAKTLLLIPEEANEKPECCSNGNFNRIQCRRGKCYCVDFDGYQDVKNTDATKEIEVDADSIEQLFCYEMDMCVYKNQ